MISRLKLLFNRSFSGELKYLCFMAYAAVTMASTLGKRDIVMRARQTPTKLWNRELQFSAFLFFIMLLSVVKYYFLSPSPFLDRMLKLLTWFGGFAVPLICTMWATMSTCHSITLRAKERLLNSNEVKIITWVGQMVLMQSLLWAPGVTCMLCYMLAPCNWSYYLSSTLLLLHIASSTISMEQTAAVENFNEFECNSNVQHNNNAVELSSPVPRATSRSSNPRSFADQRISIISEATIYLHDNNQHSPPPLSANTDHEDRPARSLSEQQRRNETGKREESTIDWNDAVAEDYPNVQLGRAENKSASIQESDGSGSTILGKTLANMVMNCPVGNSQIPETRNISMIQVATKNVENCPLIKRRVSLPSIDRHTISKRKKTGLMSYKKSAERLRRRSSDPTSSIFEYIRANDSPTWAAVYGTETEIKSRKVNYSSWTIR